MSTTTVQVGDKSLVPESVTSDKLTVLIPDLMLTTAQIMPVKVVNPSPGGGASEALNFTVMNPVPVISGLSMDNTLVNSDDFTIGLNGTGFVSGLTVQFGGTQLVPTEVSPTQVSVMVPKAVVSTGSILDVTATNGGPGGGVSNAVKFTVNNPLPAIASVSPERVLIGSPETTLEITGTGFVPEASVSLGSLVLTPASITPTSLSVVVPKEALTKSSVLLVTATNVGPGGGISNALDFTVENPVPVLNSISLDTIGAGSGDFQLVLTGSSFVSSTVNFGNTVLVPAASSETELTVTVPASAVVDGGVYGVSVTNEQPGGGNSAVLSFTVTNPAPTLTALSQKTVVLGSEAFTLVLTGTGFVHQSTVQFGSTVLEPSAYTPTQLSVLIPETLLTKSGPQLISVTNPSPGGGTSETLRFIVENPVPEVTSVSPTSLTTSSTDQTVTLLGSGFTADTTVTLGTDAVTPESIEPQAITVKVPARLLTSSGTLAFAATNPEPGGGISNTAMATVHSRAGAAWRTVVNNNMIAPGSTKLFNSYNQASVNSRGAVVFKGQTTGSSGPLVGIYLRDMSAGAMRPIEKLADNVTAVPEPNNNASTFIEFPSFPRIDRDSDMVGFRGQSQPTLIYPLSDGTETRIGTTGIFGNPEGSLTLGAGLFGVVSGFDYLQVPGTPAGTRFDQFPGSPSVVNRSTVVFKGNYTLGTSGKTGVFFRDTVSEGGKSPVQLIANSEMVIPGQSDGGSVLFESTAPPSAVNGTLAFVGLDNEDKPSMGGIYTAPISPVPALNAVVSIGSQVPGEADGVTFARFGEGLSFDGRYLAFWGAWGSEMRQRHLDCAVDGNTDMIASCNAMYPNGYDAEVPVKQGVFVYDMVTKELHAVAKNNNGEFDDFVYWVFSGRPPNVGEGGDVPEPPRWRSSSFVAVDGGPGDLFSVVFRASTGSVDGVYLATGPEAVPIQTVVDTTFSGQDIDPEAPAGSTVSSVGMERDGFRSAWFVLTSSMLDSVTGESGAGIYATQLSKP